MDDMAPAAPSALILPSSVSALAKSRTRPPPGPPLPERFPASSVAPLPPPEPRSNAAKVGSPYEAPPFGAGLLLVAGQLEAKPLDVPSLPWPAPPPPCPHLSLLDAPTCPPPPPPLLARVLVACGLPQMDSPCRPPVSNEPETPSP